MHAALAAAIALQLLAGLVRVRGWFHVIRHSCADSPVRYRDVAVAHLGGCGWNAVLPMRAGDAVKVALVRRRAPEEPLAKLGCTLVAPALVDALLTALLVIALITGGLLNWGDLVPALPGTNALPVAVALAAALLAAAVLLRRRIARIAREARQGLVALRSPRLILTRLVPWQVAARAIRAVSFALVLVAAGLPFGLVPALLLMALQGATPSAAPAATAVRIAVVAGLFAGSGVGAGHIAAVLLTAYAATSAVNLAVSTAVTAMVLRTASPRRVIAYARSAVGAAKCDPPVAAPALAPAAGGEFVKRLL